MARKTNEGLLARVNFPLYSVEMLTSRHVLVAGGGGSSKTGVANGFEIYEIYHNGQRFMAEEMLRHETGENVVMNCAVRSDKNRSYLAAGQESHCQVYFVNPKIDQDNGGENGHIETLKSTLNRKSSTDGQNLRNRKILEDVKNRRASIIHEAASQNRDNDKENRCRLRFDIIANELTQTDFSKDCPLQRVVRISLDCKLMATGGTDCCIRVWKFPSSLKIHEFKAHTKEIDDLDFSADSKRLVSIAKDGLAIVWSLETGKEHTRLNWTPPNNVKYLFKRCRFGVHEEKRGQHRLFTIVNPLGKVGKQTGFLQEWSSENGALINSVAIDESLSAMAVRDDGRFVAVGTMFSGSVSIYIAFSLQRVLHIPAAHSMFVTGLEFLPVRNADGPPISSNTEAAVVSISVDNRICIHSLTYRQTLPAWLAILLILATLFLTFTACSYLGL